MSTKTKKGFTLIELIVVTAVISLLSSIVISFIGAANTKASDTGKIRALQEVKTALNVYFNDNLGGNGSYPNEITVLTTKKYISSINTNIKYNGLDCNNSSLCKGYQLAVPLSRTDNKITYGTKSDCNSIELNTNVCYFISSNNTHGADLPYILYNNSKLYIYPTDNSSSETWGDAKNLCSNINNFGYNDWYLPSIEQIQQIIIQRNKINTDNYYDTISVPQTIISGYWSSSEVSPNRAQYISSGSYYYPYGGEKSSYKQVRCVR